MDKIKTYHIRTYGCQMNELDSEILAHQLEKRGLKESDEESSDILIFNTCSIRDLAERKVMGKLGLLSRRKKKQIIGIAGCMVMAKKEKFFEKFPHVDFLIGTNNLHELNTILDELITNNKSHKIDEYLHEEVYDLPALRKDKVKAYIPIIRGCNKFCTYCVVPHTRGREISRSSKSIINECKQLADEGYKEIFLLGQNVNSYGKDNKNNYLFHDLLYDIDKIKGIDRIRFMTSHPIDISNELVYAIRDLKSVCEFIHFPIQSGSDRILKKMNRRYTVEEYLRKVDFIKNNIPSYSLGTDIIVGFPSETEEDFFKTCDILKNVRFSCGFLFAYSPRKMTAAYNWKDDISKEEKESRLQTIINIQKIITDEEHQKLINTTQEVLIESQTDNNLVKGRTRCWKKVIFPADKKFIGTTQKVKITGYLNQTLIAKYKLD